MTAPGSLVCAGRSSDHHEVREGQVADGLCVFPMVQSRWMGRS